MPYIGLQRLILNYEQNVSNLARVMLICVLDGIAYVAPLGHSMTTGCSIAMASLDLPL
jgi:hypothetical protein